MWFVAVGASDSTRGRTARRTAVGRAPRRCACERTRSVQTCNIIDPASAHPLTARARLGPEPPDTATAFGSVVPSKSKSRDGL